MGGTKPPTPNGEADVSAPAGKGEPTAPSDSDKSEPPAGEDKVEATPEGDEGAAGGDKAKPDDAADGAEGEAETPSEDGEDVPSQSHALTPEEKEQFARLREKSGWQESVNQRIGREKQRRLDAEAKVKELEETLTAIAEKPDAAPEKIVVTPPTAADPLADVNDLAGLQERYKAASQVIDEAQGLLDRLEDSGEQEIKVGDQQWSKAQLREVKRHAERDLREHIPARGQFLARRTQAAELIKTDFPDLLDKSSKMYQEAQQAKIMYPQLVALPNGDYLIGLALRGARALAAEKAAKGSGKNGAGDGSQAGANGGKPTITPAKGKPPSAAGAGTGAVGSNGRHTPSGLQKYEAEKRAVIGKGRVTAADMTELMKQRELLKLTRNV